MPLPAPHERLVPVAVTMVNAPDLSLRGPNGAVAISGRHLQFVQSNDKTYQPIASVAAVSDRLAGWQCLQRKFIGAMPSSLSLRGGRRPTWQSRSTRPDHRKAIGENATAFPRLPRRFAPRNDKLGSLVSMNLCRKICKCTRRSLSAATVKFDSDCVRRPIAASRTGLAVPTPTYFTTNFTADSAPVHGESG